MGDNDTVKRGRPRVDDTRIAEVLRLAGEGLSETAISERMKAGGTPVSVGSVYRILAEAKPGAATPALSPSSPATSDELDPAIVFPSPLNPRRMIEDSDLDELMQSIAANGLLQAILVRPSPQRDIEGERYEVICGARRLAAVTKAIKQGLLPADYRIPARIRDCTDSELVLLAATENLARADMHPLDEAAVFAAMRPHVKPTGGQTVEEAIGKALGVSGRTVFRRLALLRCAPEVQEALRGKKITLAHAQVYTLADEKRQRHVFEEQQRRLDARDDDLFNRRMTGDELREDLIDDDELIPLDRAFFDPALYQGRIVEDAETEARYFADPAEFKRLQDLAIRAKAEELKAEWPWVEIERRDWLQGYETHGVKKTDKEAGAVILVRRDGQVLITAPALKYKTVADREKARATVGKKKTGAAGPSMPARPLTEAQINTVHLAKTRALRRGVAGDHRVALASVCLGLLGGCEVKGVQLDNFEDRQALKFTSDDRETQRLLHLVVTAALDLPEKQRPKRGEMPDFRGWADERAEADRWFAALLSLADDDLAELFRRLVAERVGSWVGFAPNSPPWYGDSDLAVTIAGEIDAAAHLPDLWHPDLDFFKGYGRDRLVMIAHDQLHIRNADKMKKGELASLCAEQPKGFWRPEHFPELRFQSEADAIAALAAPLPAVRDAQAEAAE